ncbi:MAG: hypothetical protein ACLRFJ_01715, partial [Alphaproteobacteria bacterium]
LAIANIITFMGDKFGFVNREDEQTLTARITFAPHDIYNCVKGTFSKQIISPERKEAIKTALEYFADKKLIDCINYKNCSTKYYAVTGKQYLMILEMFNDLDTKDEKNVKIARDCLYHSLARFFDGMPEFEQLHQEKGEDYEND